VCLRAELEPKLPLGKDDDVEPKRGLPLLAMLLAVLTALPLRANDAPAPKPESACPVKQEDKEEKTEGDACNDKKDDKRDAADDECDGGFKWTKVPPVRPMPSLGMFLKFPTGPGYYSLTDQLCGNFENQAPKLPYGVFAFTPASLFDVDFRYLDDPKNKQWDFFDPVKRIHLGDNWLLSLAGQTWVRTMNEVDSRLTTQNNNYQLFRTRLAGDLWYQDKFRFYAEYIYAESFNFDLEPLPIDINRSDMLNLFSDLRLAKMEDGPVYLRVGRQEMLYGSQRLISPLEWAITRRTFQGVKGFYLGKDWDIDFFWVQPVRVNRNDWDSVDNNQNFFGAWATRKIDKGVTWDSYYLYLDNTNPTAAGRNGVKGGQYLHTLGTRYVGSWCNWLYDVELMLQLGAFSNQDKVAASTPVGLGYNFSDKPWTPQVWLYYDWASGDGNPGQGNVNSTFNLLYPFGHYYFGYLDLVGRSNIQDVYGQLAFWPENWLTCLVQYHNFWLVSPKDALYSAAGVVERVDPTGTAGTYVGSELDLLVSAQLTRHANLTIGWSKLFAGEFIKNTGPDVSPELLYIQFNYRW
jgi:hypothetical protein